MGALIEVDADYLVIGAGAMGMAFTDALVHHSDATVAIVDRRHAPGGHWLDAYPFVRLHQASAFYGVASTLLGGGRLQTAGPEQGLHERATAPEICVYYADVMNDLVSAGRVQFHPGCEWTGGDGFRSIVSGTRHRVRGARVVDAAYLAPTIPATTPPPFAVEDGMIVIPVNDLVHLADPPDEYVVVGAGKTATDACIWLLRAGVDPDCICWVRPRDPWMLNRAVVQPDPAIFLGMAADTMAAAIDARTPDDLFRRLEEREIMLRIDPSVTPTMAKSPTIAHWEIEMLRTISRVERGAHLRAVAAGLLRFDDRDVRVSTNAVVVHCAASGLAYPPLVPIWQPDAIRPRPVRVGFPCFGAAMTGYVEATRADDVARNDCCRPSPYSNTPADWVRMQIVGGDASLAMAGHPDIRAWANTTTLNPSRVPADRAEDPAVLDAAARLRTAIGPGRARLVEMAAGA
ncbi:NAD(P)-binding protein [Microbacterium hominis]|uniref:NAD(P)-binding protein n=1 Tax=Microbacterium hominis TaxID=162426 RepID=A0A7D4TGC6_9MICO|nr:NAD(P)-binding protein [Microbacterium hominis]QKJ19221.1 NAD(P)-binding protein [Microbacterium hominis]